MRWCGAKAPNTNVFDVTKACLASVLPDGMDRDAYCSRGGSCPHKLLPGYTRVCTEFIPNEADLITAKKEKTKANTEVKETPPKKPRGGRGGGRSGGRGGRQANVKRE